MTHSKGILEVVANSSADALALIHKLVPNVKNLRVSKTRDIVSHSQQAMVDYFEDKDLNNVIHVDFKTKKRILNIA